MMNLKGSGAGTIHFQMDFCMSNFLSKDYIHPKCYAQKNTETTQLKWTQKNRKINFILCRPPPRCGATLITQTKQQKKKHPDDILNGRMR